MPCYVEKNKSQGWKTAHFFAPLVAGKGVKQFSLICAKRKINGGFAICALFRVGLLQFSVLGLCSFGNHTTTAFYLM